MKDSELQKFVDERIQELQTMVKSKMKKDRHTCTAHVLLG